MKKIKHSKLRNAGILFELLVRQVTADVIRNTADSKALQIIKKHFGKGGELFKELNLYRILADTKIVSEHKASALIEAVLSVRNKLDNKALRKAKYNVIKEIQQAYDVNAFFGSKVSLYQTYASIYKLFETVTTDEVFDPMDVVQCRSHLVENMMGKAYTPSTQKSKVLIEFEKQPEDVRLLTTKILIDRFNTKYKSLTESQKKLLSEYINDANGSLKQYVSTQIPLLQKSLVALSKRVKDKIVSIKLNEVIHQIEIIQKSRDLRDGQVFALLNYYSLVEELKTL